jgi:hypothetical protein
MIIHLEEVAIKFADKVGTLRRMAAIELGRKSTNNCVVDNQRALAMDIMGARAEAAGYLALKPIKWHCYVDKDVRDLPDLGDFIDVKGIEREHHSLVVQSTGKPHWAYLLVDGSRHPDYSMVGWLWGSEVMQDRFWRDPAGDRPAYFVPRAELRPFEELHRIVRERQGDAA